MSSAVEVLGKAQVRPRDVVALGIANQREVDAREDCPADADQDAAGEGGRRETVASLVAAEIAAQRGDEEEKEHDTERSSDVAELVRAVVSLVVGEDLLPAVVHARRAGTGEGDDQQRGEDDARQWGKAPQGI